MSIVYKLAKDEYKLTKNVTNKLHPTRCVSTTFQVTVLFTPQAIELGALGHCKLYNITEGQQGDERG